jgi:hypothetical protein
MADCPNCGALLHGDARFCPSWGAPSTTIQPRVRPTAPGGGHAPRGSSPDYPVRRQIGRKLRAGR